MAIPDLSNFQRISGRRTPVSQCRASWQPKYVRWLRTSDAVVVVLTVVLAQRLRFGEHGGRLDYWNVNYTVISLVVVTVWLLALAITRSRSSRVIGAGAEEYRRVWAATLSAFGVIAIFSMLFRLDIARGYLAIALPSGLVALFVTRWSWRYKVTGLRKHGEFLNSVLAVGEPRSVKSLARELARHPDYGLKVAGVCVPGGVAGSTLKVPGVGDLAIYGDGTDVGEVITGSRFDTVALTATEHLGAEGIRDLSWTLEELDVDLVVAPGVNGIANPRVVMQPVAGLPLIHLEKPQYSGAKRFQKRAFDMLFSLCVLTAAAPMMLLAAIAIKLNSPGPVFYRSERIGIDGKPFRMIKFRTMVDGADRKVAEFADLNESDGLLFKIRDDPRVTGVGKRLRKYSIDELPQFINVLRREMSVVGPRPPLPSEVASYDAQVRRRLLVLPGITGLWQVSGRSDLSWEDSVRLDLSYVENWSTIGDLLIMLKTLRPVIQGRGAY